MPPKKPSLSQLEKRTMRARGGEAASSLEAKERGVAGVIPPPMEEVLDFVRSQPYLTPNLLAEKFAIRVSIARQVLRELAEKRLVKLVVGDKRLKIYAPVREALAEVKPRKEKARKK